MTDVPGLNRLGSVQSAANDPTHPNQTLYHSMQEARVYCWLNFWVHLGQVTGLNLPHQYDYVPSKREREKNLSWLQNSFEIRRPSELRYTVSKSDPLYDQTVDVFAFHTDCMSVIPTAWGERVRSEWGCEQFFSHRIDSINPLRIAAVSTSQPGTITTEFSQSKQRWAIRIYSQYESGPAVPNRESEATRVMWFTQCMNRVATFMREKGLTRLAVPKFVGCTETIQKEWTHYSDALQTWCEQNSDLLLTVHHMT